MKKTISAVSVATIGAILLSAGAASAQPKPAKASATATVAAPDKTANGNYGYTFADDDLQGTGMASGDSVIHAGRFAERRLLIRPRSSFVQEMLKSVENL